MTKDRKDSAVEVDLLETDLRLIRSTIIDSKLDLLAINGNHFGRKPKVVLFFSVTSGAARARCALALGNTFETAWKNGLAKLRSIDPDDEEWKWIKVDVVHSIQKHTVADLNAVLASTRRNHFRKGIAFDDSFNVALLEQELNGIGAIGPDASGIRVLRLGRINRYLRTQRKIQTLPTSVEARAAWYTFETTGYFRDRRNPSGRVHVLNSGGFANGVRAAPDVSIEIKRLIGFAGSYLTNQLLSDGRFVYGYFPVAHTKIPTYNILRHCSTLYAMLEAWESAGQIHIAAHVGQGLDYVVREALHTKGDAAFVVDHANGGEIRLGAQAALILAITKFTSLTGDVRYLGVAQAVARGIVEYFLNPETGRFVHILQGEDLAIKEKFRIVYYDGEATLALLRLYKLDSNSRWLDAAKSAFENFLATDHWKHHDHWLAYCTNEITQFLPEDRYYEFGLKNVFGKLDFIHHRDTAYPTFLEMLMASLLMVRSMIDRGEQQMLEAYDIGKLTAAIHHRARHQLSSHFYPELAMYFEKPLEILGSFFIRHHSFRIRIDDVEHFISGYCLYLKHVLGQGSGDCLPAAKVAPLDEKRDDSRECALRWSADLLAVVTQGKWIKPPPPGWAAGGVCAWLPSWRPGDVVVVKSKADERGIPPAQILRMNPLPPAIMTSRAIVDLPIPTLSVKSTADAILAMGRYARTRMTGRVIGVTGSVGKTTTVGMLAHVLGASIDADLVAQSANLPLGIARVLASMPWHKPFNVIEMAVGRMGANSQLTRPDLALITNIRPAHLVYHNSTAEIAQRKAAIFLAMKAGSQVIIPRDDPEWGALQAAADLHGLRAYGFGWDPRSDFQLLAYNPEGCLARARIVDRVVDFQAGAAGKHMALNGLAVLGMVYLLGLPIDAAIARLKMFESIAGRGQQVHLKIGGRRLTVIDETFNANPASVAAALDWMANFRVAKGRKVIVLGDMLELGPDEDRYHRELAPLLGRVGADLIALCGPRMKHLAGAVEGKYHVEWYENADALREALIAQSADGDTILLKASAAMGFSRIVTAIKSIAGLENLIQGSS